MICCLKDIDQMSVVLNHQFNFSITHQLPVLMFMKIARLNHAPMFIDKCHQNTLRKSCITMYVASYICVA